MHPWLVFLVVSNSAVMVKVQRLGLQDNSDASHWYPYISRLRHRLSAAAINAFVALLGYYAAAAIVDDPDCGRLTLQQTGLAITGTLFLLCGLFRDRLSSSWLVVMYLGSSFFGQCGPNCTTFLIPTEIFPTNMRTMCHGISASAGKLGALIASILFNFVSDGEFFMISGCSSFVALVITFLTIPDTTTLDLHEIDKQWACIVSRGESKYEGPAIAPDHLSFYERNQNTLCCRKRWCLSFDVLTSIKFNDVHLIPIIDHYLYRYPMTTWDATTWEYLRIG